MSSRLCRIGGFVVVSCALALVAASSAGAALPGGYDAMTVNAPSPSSAGDRFGAAIANVGGLLLVGAPGANNGEGAIVFVNPVDGQTQRIAAPLEPSRTEGDPTNFGASVAMIPDVGKCQFPPTQAGQDCSPSATPDGVPDFLVGAPGANVNNVSGVDLGRVYVLDGSTRGVLKRIQLGHPQADPAEPVPGAPLEGKPDFGRSVSSASGLPPCSGSGGIAPCASLPDRVAKGDVDGDSVPDIVIGAPLFRENEDSNPACATPPPQTCQPTGRIYVVKGADLTAPGERLVVSDDARLVHGAPITFPYADSDSSEPPSFGAAVAPLGDVGSCDTSGEFNGTRCTADRVRSAPDGVPDLLVSGAGIDVGGVADAGAAFVVDGASATILSRIDAPNPQEGGGFGAFSSGHAAAGDLGASALPDLYVGAPGQDGATPLGQGRGYVFSGDGTLSSRLFATAEDPSPAAGGGFGPVVAPVGDIAGDGPAELLLGETGGAGDVHVYSACANATLQTIGAPAGAGGFGNALAPAGDVNLDGAADFAVGAPTSDGGRGLVFVMKSNGTPGPAFAGCNPGGGGDGGSGGGSGGATGGGSSSGATGGGAAATTPPRQGTRPRTRARRKIRLRSNRKTVRVASAVRLRGRLKASKSKRRCQFKQKVGIQRRDPSGEYWATIDVAVTKRNGSFAVRAHPASVQTFYYRARVKRTRRCAAATSRKIRVKATD